MEVTLSLVSVLGALLIGAIMPGPSFVLVARTAMAVSRIDALFVAVGMGFGGVFFSVAVLFGLQALLAHVPWLYLTFKFAGGLYLVYLALRIWRGASQPIALPSTQQSSRSSARKSFMLGLVTQLSNPKTAIVYGGIFATLLPQHLPPAAALALPMLVFVVEAGWYSIVALALSSAPLHNTYLRSKSHVDRAASGIMAFLGLKLLSAARPLS
ncbi:MAG TPA: LysE family translocator [Gammaproteobacteria bacterium]